MRADSWYSARFNAVFSVALLALTIRPALAQDTRQSADGAGGSPATMAGFSDSGTFQLYVNEERVGMIQFKWQSDGAFENTSTITMDGQGMIGSLEIVPGKDGVWTSMTLEASPGESMILTRKGSVVRRTGGNGVKAITLESGTALYDNFAPALMSQVVLNYNQDKGGKQSIPLFFIPWGKGNATLERIGTTERPVADRDVKFTRYAYVLPDVALTIWVDEKKHLCLCEVPSQHLSYVREGFESLLASAPADPLLSAPKHEVNLESNVGVPMRDGLALATDIYRPDAEGRFPVILVRTPYKKETSELQARYYARRGYVFAVQDCRGRFASSGKWDPFFNEAEDGHDVIEWLAAQPWSTGKVGMIGASYLGWVQWWAASQHPPHLVTIIPNVSPPDPFYNIPYEYGVFFLHASMWWADYLENEVPGGASGTAFSKIGTAEFNDLLDSLPVIDLDEKVLGKKNPYWRKWIEHPVNDEFWARANFHDSLNDTSIPVFHQSGWFDGNGIGSKLNYLRMKSHGHPHQKIVLGPWEHTAQSHRSAHGRDFGEEAIVDLQTGYLRWLDHWLKGVDNGIETEPLVSVFVIGSNQWLHRDEYPLPETRFEKWYLAGEGRANTSRGDGRLTSVAPESDAPHDRYTYDPGDPTPNPEFLQRADDRKSGDSRSAKSVEEERKKRGANHERVTRSRKDILVYVTEPLKKPLTIAGPVSAVIYASSSARDTDWFVRLMEVNEDGGIFQLVEGKIRARYRQTTKKPEFLEPGRVYKYEIDLWQTGITIPAGRRLRLEVASACFPLFSRNLNTGGHNEMDTEYVSAEQAIYHSRQYPSHVLLPVIPDD